MTKREDGTWGSVGGARLSDPCCQSAAGVKRASRSIPVDKLAPSCSRFLLQHSFFFNPFIAFKIIASLCFRSLFYRSLTCHVGLSCQLSPNQPAERRTFRSLAPLPRGAGCSCIASANRRKVKRSPTFDMTVRSIIRNVRYDTPDQFHQSSDRLLFVFLPLSRNLLIMRH